MRLFELHRSVDPTGISGIGVVAQGCEFDDATVVVRWLPHPTAGLEPTTVVHPSIGNVIALHGHGGGTRIVWLTPAPTQLPSTDWPRWRPGRDRSVAR